MMLHNHSWRHISCLGFTAGSFFATQPPRTSCKNITSRTKHFWHVSRQHCVQTVRYTTNHTEPAHATQHETVTIIRLQHVCRKHAVDRSPSAPAASTAALLLALLWALNWRSTLWASTLQGNEHFSAPRRTCIRQ